MERRKEKKPQIGVGGRAPIYPSQQQQEQQKGNHYVL